MMVDVTVIDKLYTGSSHVICELAMGLLVERVVPRRGALHNAPCCVCIRGHGDRHHSASTSLYITVCYKCVFETCSS